MQSLVPSAMSGQEEIDLPSPEEHAEVEEVDAMVPVDWKRLGEEAGRAVRADQILLKKLMDTGELTNYRSNGQMRVNDNRCLLNVLSSKQKKTPCLEDILVFVKAVDGFLMNKISPTKKGNARRQWLKMQAKNLKRLVARKISNDDVEGHDKSNEENESRAENENKEENESQEEVAPAKLRKKKNKRRSNLPLRYQTAHFPKSALPRVLLISSWVRQWVECRLNQHRLHPCLKVPQVMGCRPNWNRLHHQVELPLLLSGHFKWALGILGRSCLNSAPIVNATIAVVVLHQQIYVRFSR